MPEPTPDPRRSRETHGGTQKKTDHDELVDARRALAELATALRAPETISETGGAATAKDASREASENNVDHASVAAAARAAADLCDLAAATRTFFRAVPVKPFESPFVQVGAYGGDAGTVRRASYGPLAPWAFLVAWHAEFEERADKVLDLDTRGATRLPRPDGPLRRACLTGSNDRATDRHATAKPSQKGPIGALGDGFLADLLDARKGRAFESWPAPRGWEWAPLRDVADACLRSGDAAGGRVERAKAPGDASDEVAVRGSDGVFGSPALDEALAEEDDEEKTHQDASALLVAARARKAGAESMSTDCAAKNALLSAACVPAWNADRGLGATFVTSRGGLLGPARRAPRAAFSAAPSAAERPAKPAKPEKPASVVARAAATPLPRDDTTRLVERAMAEVANTLAGGVESGPAGSRRAESAENAKDGAAGTAGPADGENVAPNARPRAPAYGDAFDASAACVGCGGLGVDGHFLLCQGCPAGAHLDCLGLTAAPEGRWECDACEGGRLAGIRPPGRAGFEAAAAAAGKVGGPASGAAGAAGGVAGLSVVPGAVAPVPSVGPLAVHHLAASVVVDFVRGDAAARAAAEAARADDAGGGAAAGSKRSAREAFLDESADGVSGIARGAGSGFGPASPGPGGGGGPGTPKRVEASFPMPRTCASAVAVECGGALGEFRVTEGLVHCFCRGCQAACEVGLQPTNVFGLQAFEFHGGKGSAGKWKASVKCFPRGFPPELLRAEPGEEVPVRRDAGEPLGNWLERECPEHPVLSRSRLSKD